MHTGRADIANLLDRYEPIVYFDSHEAFFAHDVAAMADECQEFRLTRQTEDANESDYVIATHAPGPETLSREFLSLSNGAYPNGMPFHRGDHFGLRLPGPDEFVSKVGDYRAMERSLTAAVRDRVYGRAVRDDGGLWLQYWYFSIYNDAQFAGRVDLHEGDWEMVQFRIGPGGDAPDTAVYAQHAYSESRGWPDVELDDGHPVVYSGRGSHASYFQDGLHRTHVKVSDQVVLPLWWDAADGKGRRVRQTLVVLDPIPGWAQWTGIWGGTQARISPLDGDSPQGPIAHHQWDHPSDFATHAISHERIALDPAPEVQLSRAGQTVEVGFDFRDQAGSPTRPDRLLVTVTSDHGPPITETIVVDSLTRGQVFTQELLDPEVSYWATASTISVAGRPTAPARPVSLDPQAPPATPPLLAALDRFWQRIGGQLARPQKR